MSDTQPEVVKLGLLPFRLALTLMEKMHSEVSARRDHSGYLLMVEHPPVVTMGNRFIPKDMLVGKDFLERNSIDFVKIDRGGSVTVHEPGQIVVYPILRLDGVRLTVKVFVHSLEEAMIRVAARHGVTIARDPINAGVWAGRNKMGAIGIRVCDRVSKHGLAFNVCNDLSTFRHIVPCGLRDRGVTTLRREVAASRAGAPQGTPQTLPPSPETIGEQIAAEIILQIAAI